MSMEQPGFFEHLYAVYLSDLGYSDFVIPLSLFMWLVLLGLNLKSIDCSHPITALTYVLACTAAGVALIIALPPEELKNPSLKAQIIWGLFFVGLSTARWLRAYFRQQAGVNYYSKKKEN